MESPSSRRILVVDDDEGIRLQLSWQLEADGYEVDTAADGASALAAVKTRVPNLVVLDLTLPRLTGLDVLKTLRATASTSRIPVIILSGRSSEEDRIRGLDAGADDYLIKPFSPGELGARVRSLLRRTEPQPAPGPDPTELRVDPLAREVWVRGEPVDLTAKEFDLLAFLAAHPRQVFSRTQLLHRVWDNDGWQSEATVTEHVRRVRSKIDEPGAPSAITTIRGVGYRLEA